MKYEETTSLPEQSECEDKEAVTKDVCITDLCDDKSNGNVYNNEEGTSKEEPQLFFSYVKFVLMPNCSQIDAGDTGWDFRKLIAECKS